MTAGTCFGFDVQTEVPLRYLRAGDGAAPLAVGLADQAAGDGGGEIVGVWRPTLERPTLDARLHTAEGGYRFWVEGAGGGWFDVAPAEGRIGVPPADDEVRREERLWGVPAALCFLAAGDLSLHAAAVEVDGGALVLAAPSQYGKTTLAAAFAVHGARLLSEDLCRVRRGAPPELVPGPAMLRLRHDTARRLAVPGGDVVARDDDRVHIALPREGRGTCDPVPVRAVVLLRGEAQRTTLTRVPAPEVLRDLFALALRLPGADETARCFDGVTRLVEAVPAYELRRPVSFDALPATVEEVIASA